MLQLRVGLRTARLRGQVGHVHQEGGGNPAHPGSRGRNCAKGPATINQVNDPERILHPLKRVGTRGSGRWDRVSWDDALDDIAARIRAAIVEDRRDEVMYHVGRPGEDGFAERFLLAWGVDGHNSHTNICSAGARLGYSLWGGYDRPSPDYANAKVILLISSHLEAGHYFNPHAQRIMEGKIEGGATVVVLDPRLSNTASHADLWIAPWPGSEAAILLAVAAYLLRTGQIDRAFIRRWVNWSTYMTRRHPEHPADDFDQFIRALTEDYAGYTFAYAAQEAQVPEEQIAELARIVATAGRALSAHVWRAAASGNLGGWQVSRALFFLNVLTGSVGTKGGTSPNGWDKIIAHGPNVPEGHQSWNEMIWPAEFPLSTNEMSILLPHLLEDGRGKLSMYFSRVYNPVWTNPDGFSWLKALTDEQLVGCHVALTPTWSETATFADYVLPMGHSTERHDTQSYEQYAGKWLGFRQPVTRVALEKMGRLVSDSRESNPGGGVGGERILVRAVLAHRPRRQPRHPEVLRVAVPAGREGRRRRVLPLGLREQRARPATSCRRPGADPPCNTCESTASSRSPRMPIDSTSGHCRTPKSKGATPDGNGVLRKPVTLDSTPPLVGGGGCGGSRPRGRQQDRRLAHAVAQTRAVQRHHGRLRVGGVRHTRLHRVPRQLPLDRPGQQRDCADADLPAPDPGPHAIR